MGQGVIKPGSTPLVRHEIEYLPTRCVTQLPSNMTALYVLYSYDNESRHMNVCYVGYANHQNGDDARSMLQLQHRLNGRMWSHFSVYELWDHFQKDDAKAVDALFNHVYRRDSHLRTHLVRNRRIETSDNVFIPKVLFVDFIDRISRASTKVVVPRPANQNTIPLMFES